MSRHEYTSSIRLSIQGWPFYALIMAAMRQADTRNLELLKAAWPEIWQEYQARGRAPGGVLPGDQA